MDSKTRFSTLQSLMTFEASFADSSSSAVRGRFKTEDDGSEDIEMNDTNEFKKPDSTLTDGVDDESFRSSRTLKWFLSLDFRSLKLMQSTNFRVAMLH